MTNDEVKQLVTSIWLEEFGEIDLQASMQSQIDSLDMVEFLMLVEDSLSVDYIDEVSIENMAFAEFLDMVIKLPRSSAMRQIA